MHRESPLGDHVRPWRRIRANIACRPPLDGQAVALLGRDKLYDLSVGNNGDGKTVNLRHPRAKRLCVCSATAFSKGTHERGHESSAAAADEIAPRKRGYSQTIAGA